MVAVWHPFVNEALILDQLQFDVYSGRRSGLLSQGRMKQLNMPKSILILAFSVTRIMLMAREDILFQHTRSFGEGDLCSVFSCSKLWPDYDNC